MSDPVKVSSIDVQRARLLVRLDRELGDATPEFVTKIAEAKPVRNGHSHPKINGSTRPLPDAD